MRALLFPVGSHGDVHPLVGLGEALKARGHAVTVCTNGHFESLVRQAGLDFVALGSAEDYRRALEDPDLWHPTRGVVKVIEMAMLALLRPTYQVLAERYVAGDTVVVASALCLGARVAQEKLGVPVVTTQLQPAVFRSAVAPPRLPGLPSWAPGWYARFLFWLADRLVLDRLLAPPLDAFRAELGLPPVRRIMGGWWNSPLLVLGLFPDWYAAPAPDWPPQVRLAGFPLYDERSVTRPDPDVEAFLAAGAPPAVFTPGSAMAMGRWFFEAAAEGCARAGMRGVLLTRFQKNIPERLPAGVRHFPYVPFSRLLPRAAALVHHGGIGTTAQGLAAGVPQLVMPLSHDQPDNAARLARLGVGRVLKPKAFRGPRVAECLRVLLDDPGVRARCREVAGRFSGARPLERACDLIEDAFRRGSESAR